MQALKNVSLKVPETESLTELASPDVSDKMTVIFIWVVVAAVCQVIDTVGIITNIINIICFVKQGFKDSVNISLLGLAVSDLGSLVTLVMTNVFYTMSLSVVNVSFDVLDVFYLAVAMPHLAFTRVTCWITAFITLERCLCIIAPLKIRTILTPRSTAWIIVCLFITLIFSGAPIYAVESLDLKFSPSKNRTIVGIVVTGDRRCVEKITFAINNFFIPTAAFIIIAICTVILVISLRNRTKWQSSFKTTGPSEVPNRNQRVAKMVVMISTLFIFCFVPLAVTMLAFAFEPNLTVRGKYVNIGTMVGAVSIVLESINSSVNIIIYYRMSSKYRDAFGNLFFFWRKS